MSKIVDGIKKVFGRPVRVDLSEPDNEVNPFKPVNNVTEPAPTTSYTCGQRGCKFESVAAPVFCPVCSNPFVESVEAKPKEKIFYCWRCEENFSGFKNRCPECDAPNCREY